MKRRDFLKCVLGAGAALALPIPEVFAENPYPDFDPMKCYGDFFTGIGDIPAKDWVGALDRDVAKHIPAAYRKQVEYWRAPVAQGKDPLRQQDQYCWKYRPVGSMFRGYEKLDLATEPLREGEIPTAKAMQFSNHRILNDGPMRIKLEG